MLLKEIGHKRHKKHKRGYQIVLIYFVNYVLYVAKKFLFIPSLREILHF